MNCSNCQTEYEPDLLLTRLDGARICVDCFLQDLSTSAPNNALVKITLGFARRLVNTVRTGEAAPPPTQAIGFNPLIAPPEQPAAPPAPSQPPGAESKPCRKCENPIDASKPYAYCYPCQMQRPLCDVCGEKKVGWVKGKQDWADECFDCYQRAA